MPDKFSHLPPENAEFLRQRYGIGKSSSARRFVAVVVAAVFLPWLLWSAWHHSNPEIRVTLISFQNLTNNSIDITYLVERRDPATPLICTLLARDFDKNVVGEIQRSIPASESNKLKITTTIPTRIAPVNATILECRAAQA
jgi:hypothetical protein